MTRRFSLAFKDSDMRTLLNALYRASGAAAALGMIATLVMVMTGVVSRPLGIYLRGTDDYAGYYMAACGFLALAYTFKHGEHIRVSLVIERLGPKMRRAAEWMSLAAGTLVSGALAWYSIQLVWQSHQFGDVSPGVDATPLWIPQIGMAAGCLVFFIALLDDLVTTSLGHAPHRFAHANDEPAHME